MSRDTNNIDNNITSTCNLIGTFISAAMIPLFFNRGKSEIENGNFVSGTLLMVLGGISAGICTRYVKDYRKNFHHLHEQLPYSSPRIDSSNAAARSSNLTTMIRASRSSTSR